jgi:hypothetical protein
MLKNQVPEGSLANVLHDQGVPNTLSGMTFEPIGRIQSRSRLIGVLAVIVTALAVAAAIVIVRAG